MRRARLEDPPLIGKKRLDEITDADVMTLKAKLAKKNAKTVNNVLTVMTKMLKVAKRMGKLDEVPVDVELLKVPPSPFSFYDYEEYDRLVKAAEKLDPPILVTVLLSGDAGLRPGETVGLEQSDVKWVRRPVLTVQRQVWWGQVGSPKNGRSRNIRMTEKLAAALTSIRHLRGERFLYQDKRAAGDSEGTSEVAGERPAARRAQGDGQPLHAPAHLLLAPRDGRLIRPRHQGDGRPQAPLHDDAVHAPLPQPHGRGGGAA